jgi:thiamine kinase-like enzyme
LFFSGCTTHLNNDVDVKNEIMQVASRFATGDKTGLQEIEGGLSDSEVYVFKSREGQRYVLKKGGSWPGRDGKLMELALHKFCSTNGISPKLLYVDDEKNPKIVVMDYIDGKLLARQDFYNEELLDNIVKNLRCLHSMPINPTFKKRTLLSELKASVARVKKKNLALPSKFDGWCKYLFELLSKLESTAMVQCHCDLSSRNILIENRKKVYFIDFQCTLRGNPLFDIAHLLYKLDLNDEEILRKILRKYLGREATTAEIKRIFFYESVAAFIAGQFRLQWLKNTTTAELDKFMSQATISSSHYLEKGDLRKKEFQTLSQRDKIEYVLSFFKDFLRFGKEAGISFNEEVDRD